MMKSIKSYMYTPVEIQLAHEISERLNDPDSMSQYLGYTQQVRHEVIREKLNYVCSLPDRKIETSRVAYFVFLMEQWKGRNRNSNNGDSYGSYHARG
jgi:hypothetical protein